MAKRKTYDALLSRKLFITAFLLLKANPTKGGIIAELADFMEHHSEYAAENVTITNKERMIAFRIGDNDYEITLIQKRKKKT